MSNIGVMTDEVPPLTASMTTSERDTDADTIGEISESSSSVYKNEGTASKIESSSRGRTGGNNVTVPTDTSGGGCQVRVAVRVRPLAPMETSKGGTPVVDTCPINRTVGIGKRKFTFDAVFDSTMEQTDLYRNVSGPLLASFLDGYNATIMAYGQTGSGKTYTMGSEAHPGCTSREDSIEGDSCPILPLHMQGLLPRFLNDIFDSLNKPQSSAKLSNGDEENFAKAQAKDECYFTASFLEVYGEDVHDLLDDTRKALPLREDGNGGVMVVGLKSVPIANVFEALNVLHMGTMNRTTAATLMNHSSSRSHAVFAISFSRTIKRLSGSSSATEGASATLDLTTSSRLTFVDLAGSERMKKTGAEGERAREGIRINEGLLALGNVINALADEERLARGEKVHVPYRQSKLTRLLQDALGGNSQTLFLACVSPSDTNSSETLSTLQYANRARNIKNAPTKNVDANALELQRLQNLNFVLERELIKHRFPLDCDSTNNIDEETQYKMLFDKKEVQEYLESVHQQAAAKASTASLPASSRPIAAPVSEPSLYAKNHPSLHGEVGGASFVPMTDNVDAQLLEANPDEDMAIIDKLFELQHHNQAFDEEQKEGERKLNEVEGELQEQEDLLLQLRDSLKVYHDMKEKYQVLIGEVQQLEVEKASLADELERVRLDPSKGCSIAIKQKLDKVEHSLARARNETRKHQQMYKKAELEAQKCKALERKINDLKHSKVVLMRKQKEDALKHKEFTDAKTKEVQALKRKEKKTEKQLCKLETEFKQHRAIMERRKTYANKLSTKLKETESHLMKLLTMRKKELLGRNKASTQASRNSSRPSTLGGCQPDLVSSFSPVSEEVSSVLFLLKKMLSERALRSEAKARYEERVTEFGRLMKTLVSDTRQLEDLQPISQSDDNYIDAAQGRLEEIKQLEQTLEETELQIELIGSDLEELSENQGCADSADGLELENSREMSMIAGLHAPIVRTILWEILHAFSAQEIDRRQLARQVERKDANIRGLQEEIKSVRRNMLSLSRGYERLSVAQNSGQGRSLICDSEATKFDEQNVESLNKLLFQKSKDLDVALARTQDLSAQLNECYVDYAVTREKLTVKEASTATSKADENAQLMLSELQDLWTEIGVDASTREKFRIRIEYSLVNTCDAILLETRQLLSETNQRIREIKNQLSNMHSALGSSEDFRDLLPLGEHALARLASLESQLRVLQPRCDAAKERRSLISRNADKLVTSLGIHHSALSENLKVLLPDRESAQTSRKRTHHSITRPMQDGNREQRAKMLKDVENMVRALEPLEEVFRNDVDEPVSGVEALECTVHSPQSQASDVKIVPNTLSQKFLDECESEVKMLRLRRRQVLAKNGEICETARKLVQEMHLSKREILSHGIHMIKKGARELPEWWEASIATEVCDCLSKSDAALGINPYFTQHLQLFSDCLHRIAGGRRILSDILKSVVEGAYKALVSTVEGEAEANDAYLSFHEAMFRLPSMSKEHIHACIDEIKTLVNAVEAVSQSEIESLTVVWEALNISSGDRGNFWSEIEETTTKLKSETGSVFDDVLHTNTGDLEEWILSDVKDAAQVHRSLDMKLFKLRRIHTEVEKQRAKQDIRSKILSLDEEVRLISGSLSDFEEKASKKQRLLTKKMNSSYFLKEERFRKHIQAKFSSKLESLGDLLAVWQEQEGASFNIEMLSEDVRSMVRNTEGFDASVERRTAFMHLKTTASTGRSRSTEETAAKDSSSVESRIADSKRSKSPTRKAASGGQQIQVASPSNSKPGSARQSPGRERSDSVTSFTRQSSIKGRRTKTIASSNLTNAPLSPLRPSSQRSAKSPLRGSATPTKRVGTAIARERKENRGSIRPHSAASTAKCAIRNEVKTLGENRWVPTKGNAERKGSEIDDSPPRVAMLPKNKATSPKRDTISGPLLPFGDLLQTTPSSKENSGPYYFR